MSSRSTSRPLGSLLYINRRARDGGRCAPSSPDSWPPSPPARSAAIVVSDVGARQSTAFKVRSTLSAQFAVSLMGVLRQVRAMIWSLCLATSVSPGHVPTFQAERGDRLRRLGIWNDPSAPGMVLVLVRRRHTVVKLAHFTRGSSATEQWSRCSRMNGLRTATDQVVPLRA
jgi:hypothetical protein